MNNLIGQSRGRWPGPLLKTCTHFIMFLSLNDTGNVVKL